MTRDLVELAVRALAETQAEKAPGTVDSELRPLVDRAVRGLKGRVEIATEEIDSVMQAVAARPPGTSGFETTRRDVARWFEIPLDDFDQVPADSLQPEVLFRHMYYEQVIARWFADWGYRVDVGEELDGMEGADFIPDVYARLDTLHGRFQVAVTLFCQASNTDRVRSMLECIEAYARKGSEFGERDIYLLVTPYKFGEQASSAIRIQIHEEDYFVVALEGDDLRDLEMARDTEHRRERLLEFVEATSRMKLPGHGTF